MIQAEWTNKDALDVVSRHDALMQLSHNKKLGDDEWELAVNNDIQTIEQLPSAEPERKTFRVIDTKTGKEADTYEIALHEEWAKGLIYCDMEGFAIEEDGTLILIDECGKYAYCPEGRFEVVWDE